MAYNNAGLDAIIWTLRFLIIFNVRSRRPWPLSFCCWILWILYFQHFFFSLWDPAVCPVFMKTTCIFKIWPVLRSQGSWILRILDPKFLFRSGILEIPDPNFLFCREILEILDLTKWFCRGILQILDLDILFCRQILQILDPDFWLRHMSDRSIHIWLWLKKTLSSGQTRLNLKWEFCFKFIPISSSFYQNSINVMFIQQYKENLILKCNVISF